MITDISQFQIQTNTNTKTISKTDLYRQLKQVGDDVMQHGETYIVFQGSKPAFQIAPLPQAKPRKKYTKDDLHKFIFPGKNPNESYSTTYKDFLYK